MGGGLGCGETSACYNQLLWRKDATRRPSAACNDVASKRKSQAHMWRAGARQHGTWLKVLQGPVVRDRGSPAFAWSQDESQTALQSSLMIALRRPAGGAAAFCAHTLHRS